MTAPEREIIIEARNVGKTYRMGRATVDALLDVDLQVYHGEYLSVMGPSGSGKTTLFNMIGALDHPSTGTVKLAGIDLNSLTRRQLAYFRGRYIGYVFQTFNLIPALSAQRNVALPALFGGSEMKEAMDRAAEILKRVGLGHRLRHRPDELSGGQQQRVAIARALVVDPLIVLADEPTGNLDLHTGEEIINLLKQVSDDMNATVITATHDHKMLAASDRIVWISDGRIERVESAKDMDIRAGTIEEVEESGA
jgi:putative ABC transport system ATP-binding protein